MILGLESRSSQTFRFRIAVATILVATIFMARAVVAEDVELAPATFLDEYRAALKRQAAEQTKFQIDGKIHQVYDRFDGKPPMRDQYIPIKSHSNGKYKMLMTEYPQLERVFFDRDTKRSFSLKRSSGKNQYSLEFIDVIPPNLVAFKAFTDNAARTIGDEILTPLVESPRFTINRATRKILDGRDVVRVNFGYRPLKPEREYDMKGEMSLDPSNNLAIVDYAVKRAVPDLVLEISGSVRYSDQKGCRLLPEELLTRQVGRPTPDRRFETRHEFRAERISAEPPADSIFDPTTYGLIDLDKPRSRPGNHAPYWAFGIGAFALVIMFVLRRMAR